MLLILLIAGICIASSNQVVAKASLETITDQELINLMGSEKYMIVLFTTSDCKKCEQYEDVVTSIREDFVDSLSAWVVKVIDSQLIEIYTADDEPALVFFRDFTPMLYNGPLEEEEILSMFIYNKESVVRGLTDENFEHLTQASTGATTGDWLVLFFSTDDIESMKLNARWETVGAKLKGRTNVAKVDRYTNGGMTTRRFDVDEVPEIIFLRLGKFYRYQGSHDIDSLVAFVKKGYKKVVPQIVPRPQSAFDDTIHIITNCLRSHPLVMKFASMLSCIIVIIIMLFSKLKQKRETSQSENEDLVSNDNKSDSNDDDDNDDDAHQATTNIAQKKDK